MKFKNLAFNHLPLLLVAVIFTSAIISCSNPEKDFEEAKRKNTIEAFEDYITKYPESKRIDEVKNMILDIAYNNALRENTIKAFNNFINKYNPTNEYISKIDERIRQKKEDLQLAIETHILAQQETNHENMKQLFYKSEELFNKANFEESMLEILSFPLLNLHLGEKSKLKKVIDRPFQTTRYIYGSSTEEYEYLVKNEQLNTYTLYNLILGSGGRTSFLMKVILKRGNKELEICNNKLSIYSKNYTAFSGLIKNNDIVLQKGDKIVLKITATGDNYVTSCGNFKSFIKILKPKRTMSDDVLSEKVSALSWIISNMKHNYPSSLLLNFIAQIDYCLLENKKGVWKVGWKNMKNNEPYKVKWYNNTFIAEKLTMEQAQDLGIKKYHLSYTID